MPVAKDNVETFESFKYLDVDIHNTVTVQWAWYPATYCNSTQLRGFRRGGYVVISGTLALPSLPHQATILSSLHPSGHSLWSRNMVFNSHGIWMSLTSGVCGAYYAFPGGPVLRMMRSADILMSHHSHIIRTIPLKNKDDMQRFFGC